MEFGIIDQVLAENIDLLDRATSGIRQCLPAYEKRCAELIHDIATRHSFAESEEDFDKLLEIQGCLATLLFKYRFEIGDKLEILTREFDRLYDPYIREYWYKKFKAGAAWPELPATT